MGRSVRPHKPGAVNRKAHGQPLQRDIVDDLIIAALQEGRIDRAERPQPPRRHPGAEGHPMLLGNADIEAPIREPLGKKVQSGAPGIAAVTAVISGSASA